MRRNTSMGGSGMHTPTAETGVCVSGEAAMAMGTIKKLVQEKGFGFIARKDGPDVFFHHSSVSDRQFESLTIGQSVEFTIDDASSSKGPRAASVRPV